MKPAPVVVFAATLASLALLVACSSNDGAAAEPSGPPPRDPAVHRPTAPATCASPRGSSPPTSDVAGCRADAECTEGLNGRCLQAGLGYAQCSYDTCTDDAACGEGAMCLCRSEDSEGPNVCVTAGCRTDADCGGPWCSPSRTPDGCGGTSLRLEGYFCHGAADTCIDDADCQTEGASGGATCDYDPELRHWRCSVRRCVSD